ncbi:hypothetical protein M8C21_017832, partial [Ambrosia artemisiifolia]
MEAQNLAQIMMSWYKGSRNLNSELYVPLYEASISGKEDLELQNKIPSLKPKKATAENTEMAKII